MKSATLAPSQSPAAVGKARNDVLVHIVFCGILILRCDFAFVLQASSCLSQRS